jgi:hypothetical protein
MDIKNGYRIQWDADFTDNEKEWVLEYRHETLYDWKRTTRLFSFPVALSILRDVKNIFECRICNVNDDNQMLLGDLA